MGDSSSLAAITGDIWPKERALVARQLAIVAGATYSSEWLAKGMRSRYVVSPIPSDAPTATARLGHQPRAVRQVTKSLPEDSDQSKGYRT